MFKDSEIRVVSLAGITTAFSNMNALAIFSLAATISSLFIHVCCSVGFAQDVYYYNVSEASLTTPESLCSSALLPEASNQPADANPTLSPAVSSDGAIYMAHNSINERCLENRVIMDRDGPGQVEVYRFNYSFESGGQTYRTTVIFVLLDVNDNSPQFNPSPERQLYSVNENSPLNTVVATISATDDDKGLNGAVRYSLVGCDSVFAIGRVSGNITVQGMIDYEAHQSFDCSVTASDSSIDSPLSSTANFTIRVNNINDNAPHCIDLQPVYNVMENQDTRQRQSICKLDDSDGNSNCMSLNASVDYSDRFGVTLAGCFLFVDFLTPLNREDIANYSLVFRVNDNGNPQQTGVIEVYLVVLDVNDNPPMCSALQKIHVRETTVGKVGEVNCSDRDPSSILEYSLSSVRRGSKQLPDGSISLGNSGEILVNDPTAIDYEAVGEKTVTLSFSVSDGNHTTQSSVVFDIVNEDDNPPVFEMSDYQFTIPENRPRNSSVGTVKAHDADGAPYNMVRYSLHADNTESFYIDPDSGEITTRKVLDAELAPRFQFEVHAKGIAPSRQSGSTNVEVKVLNLIDSCPYFGMPVSFNISQSDAIIGFMFGTLVATDPDGTVNDQISYRLEGEPPYVAVDEDSGKLCLKSEVNSSHIGMRQDFIAIATSSKSFCINQLANTTVSLTVLQLVPSTPSLPLFVYVIIGCVVPLVLIIGIFLICIVCCCCARRQKVFTDTYPISSSPPPGSPAVELKKHKSILKSYSETTDSEDMRQRNSVRFVEVINKNDIHFFDKEAPPSSPGLSNGHVNHKELEDIDSPQPMSPSSGVGFEEDSQSLTSDSSIQKYPIEVDNNINQGYEMDLPPEGYRPPTPPRRRSAEEHLPFAFPSAYQPPPNILPPSTFTRYYSPDNRAWFNAERDMVQLSTSPHRSRPYYPESGTSATASDDRDSLSDNFSVLTEPGTDVAFGPMESLMSRIHQTQQNR